MKTPRIIGLLMLLLSLSVSAEEKKDTFYIKVRTPLEHGVIEIPTQKAAAGQTVDVICKPHPNYGVAKGPFYAVKYPNGEFGAPEVATPDKNFNPHDRANETQRFKVTMPAGNIEVWVVFGALRTMIIHKAANGYLKPLYGRDKNDTTVVRNMPNEPIVLKVLPDKDYQLIGVNITGVDESVCVKTPEQITIPMPNDKDTVHVTPVFGKSNYNVTTETNPRIVTINVGNSKPKAYEEVDVEILTNQGYIPSNISITGCKSWWRVEKPKLQQDGKWRVVYRFKVDLQDVHVKVLNEQVYTVAAKDQLNSGRITVHIPDMIPDFPGVARDGQQVPVIFQMPERYKVAYKLQGSVQNSLVYHNALQNSFADEGMDNWTETQDYVNNGLPMTVATDTVGNKYWHASVKNSMSQTVSIAGRNDWPAQAKDGDNLKIAAIASINPCRARTANVKIVASGTFSTPSELVVSDLQDKNTGWVTELKTGTVNAKATELKLIVNAQGYNQDKKRAYEGPMFDDLCLLLPTSADTIRNEDVLIFTVNKQDVTVNYTPMGNLNVVKVAKPKNATVTLRNTVTGEEGDSVYAVKNDLIVVKGKADEGYFINSIAYAKEGNTSGKPLKLRPDSLHVDEREYYYSFTMEENQNYILTSTVDKLKIKAYESYGGSVQISNTKAAQGEKVEVIVTPNPGCKLKQIGLTPAGVVTLQEDEVDATTRGGKYSFVMTGSQVTLIPEFVVPIKSAAQLDSISGQWGEFRLDNDLDLGDKWNQEIRLRGYFNGNGHRITYGGNASLFSRVLKNGSVRHLNVKANVNGSDDFIGGIVKSNSGIIEDCEVSGTVKNGKNDGAVGGIAGENNPGTISHCHVLCDVIEGKTAYGIAYQYKDATIRDNVFSGQLVFPEGRAYMISNDNKSSSIESNYYIHNDLNSRAEVCSGVNVATPTRLLSLVKDWTETYPVLAASIKSKYGDGFDVEFSFPADVTLVNVSTKTATAGTVVRASVRVLGNNHLTSLSVAARNGTDARYCKFTDDMDNVYSFSFVMPDHDVRITAMTQPGQFIYTQKQFAEIDDVSGTFYLARDLELNNWEKQIYLNGTFDGGGHTIKYNASNKCSGLFYKIRSGAQLKRLRVVGAVETLKDCGGITYHNQGTISDCHFTGQIKKLSKVSKKQPKTKLPDYVSAIACIVEKDHSKIEYCSASAVLTAPNSQETVDKNPLCYQGNETLRNCSWIHPTQTSQYEELVKDAEAAAKNYPVYAQGIQDKINPRVIVGTDTIRVQHGTTLDELTIIDGKPFTCTSDVRVKRIIYKRNTARNLEQWVLPFGFDRIAGNGSFEYHKAVINNNKPDIDGGTTLALTQSPATISYQANKPMMIKSNASEYVLTNSNGSITIKATDNKDIDRYASPLDKGLFYATYDTVPAKVAKQGLMYRWDVSRQDFVCSDSVAIEPFRFYLQFYNQEQKGFVTYTTTWWYKNEAASSGNRAAAAPRRMAAAIADGWQPIFLDPRQPQSITADMLDDYEVAYLVDMSGKVVSDDPDAPLSAVSLVYQMTDSYMDLPTALPLLVRAKRSDATPLVTEQMGAEIEEQLLSSVIQAAVEDKDVDEDDFDMPHYWCASFGNRLDFWPMPSSEVYADWADTDCMLFDDNRLEQSFNYPVGTDTRTTPPMSYCISVLNTDTFEPLSLLGDRVYVEILPSASQTTGLTTIPSLKGEESGHTYNLNGQRVDATYKGIILQNGRKIYKK